MPSCEMIKHSNMCAVIFMFSVPLIACSTNSSDQTSTDESFVNVRPVERPTETTNIETNYISVKKLDSMLSKKVLEIVTNYPPKGVLRTEEGLKKLGYLNSANTYINEKTVIAINEFLTCNNSQLTDANDVVRAIRGATGIKYCFIPKNIDNRIDPVNKVDNKKPLQPRVVFYVKKVECLTDNTMNAIIYKGFNSTTNDKLEVTDEFHFTSRVNINDLQYEDWNCNAISNSCFIKNKNSITNKFSYMPMSSYFSEGYTPWVESAYDKVEMYCERTPKVDNSKLFNSHLSVNNIPAKNIHTENITKKNFHDLQKYILTELGKMNNAELNRIENLLVNGGYYSAEDKSKYATGLVQGIIDFSKCNPKIDKEKLIVNIKSKFGVNKDNCKFSEEKTKENIVASTSTSSLINSRSQKIVTNPKNGLGTLINLNTIFQSLNNPVSGEDLFMVEDVRCDRKNTMRILLYKGKVTGLNENLKLKLSKRYALKIYPEETGINSKTWNCIPYRFSCYSEVEFTDWGGSTRKGQELKINNLFSYREKNYSLQNGANLIGKGICK